MDFKKACLKIDPNLTTITIYLIRILPFFIITFFLLVEVSHVISYLLFYSSEEVAYV